jgi:ubiquinone/menaquinone biosynthesis C-methylase UbiE
MKLQYPLRGRMKRIRAEPAWTSMLDPWTISLPPKPTKRDLEIWERVKHDLLHYLYRGLTGRIQISGHQIIDRWANKFAGKMILEIGCGEGHHLLFGNREAGRYTGLDIEKDFLRTLKKNFPSQNAVRGDAYSLPFQNGSIDCVLSIYNFEHLRNLSESLAEIRRVLKSKGELLAAFPLEGGILYRIGRRLTSKRYMEKKYGINYDAIVHWEHCNTFNGIERRLKEKFWVEERRYLPFSFFPFPHGNVIQCLRLRPKSGATPPRRND